MAEIGSEFMDGTRYRNLSPSDQQRGIPQPPLQLPQDPSSPDIDLPLPQELPDPAVGLRTLIDGRRSTREYADRALSLAELSYLLWCTQGVQKVVGNLATFRTVPSAGSRHAMETYLLVNRVEGLPAGLYRFLAIGHRLVSLREDGRLAEDVTAACFGQAFLLTSAVTFLWAAVPDRMTWRYGQRGYRYLLLDAGHVCQNLYLAAESIDCAACAIAAFDDDAVNAAVGLDGQEQFALYLATIGRKARV